MINILWFFSNRDALATRLYIFRMMENFISPRKIASELTEFDGKTETLYMVCHPSTLLTYPMNIPFHLAL